MRSEFFPLGHQSFSCFGFNREVFVVRWFLGVQPKTNEVAHLFVFGLCLPKSLPYLIGNTFHDCTNSALFVYWWATTQAIGVAVLRSWSMLDFVIELFNEREPSSYCLLYTSDAADE